MHDIVKLLPLRLGRVMRRIYLSQIARCPESWESTLRRLELGTVGHRWATRLLRTGGRRVLVVAKDADLVISTHPFASQVLGGLRHRGALSSPVATYLTDASVHALWVAQGVDLHLAIHPGAAEDARALGGRTATTRPLVPFSPPRARSRKEFGLPDRRVVAVVTGGSLGIGALGSTAEDLLAAGITPVVLCGTNKALHHKLSAVPGVIALGWQEDVREVFGIADVVVQNSGGFMTLEALAMGVPLVSYGVLPGHGRANASGLESAGLAPWIRSPDLLGQVIGRLLALGGPSLPDSSPDIVEVLSGRWVPDDGLLAAGAS